MSTSVKLTNCLEGEEGGKAGENLNQSNGACTGANLRKHTGGVSWDPAQALLSVGAC